jgi:cytochrome c-type biogenesis protein CcmH/NrfG
MWLGSSMSSLSPESPRSRAWSYAFGGVGVVAACVTPVVATGAWLLLTDGEIAADVATSGDLMPLALAIAETLGEALRDLLAYL